MIRELVVWLQSQDPAFLFLLVLPFVVAIVGLLTELAERRRLGGRDSRSRQAPSGHHVKHAPKQDLGARTRHG